MNLYCEACNQLHRITAGDAEKIIYVLEAEQRHDPARLTERPGPNEPTCLLQFLSPMAYDIELYAEHVESNIEVRLRREKERRQASIGVREGVAS